MMQRHLHNFLLTRRVFDGAEKHPNRSINYLERIA